MPHGHKDWGVAGAVEHIHSVQDMGESAARLGSIVTWSRSGNVLWLSGFEDGLSEWEPIIAGALATVAIDTTHAYQGAQCCKVTGDGADPQANGLRKWMHPITTTLQGSEWVFAVHNGMDEIYIQHDVGHDGAIDRFRFYIDWASENVYYLKGNNTYGLLQGYSTFRTNKYDFINFKFVVDPENNLYNRLQINETIIDMTDKHCKQSSGGTYDYIMSLITALNRAGQADLLYVDKYILTVNEPE